MTLMISKFRYLLPCVAAVALTACAPLTVPPKAEYPVGRARLVLPPGAWQDLGVSDEALPGPGGRAALQTRAMGLRDAQGGWLAVLRVQTNRSGDLSGPEQRVGYCPSQQGVTVEDAVQGNRVRADCLRLKSWASGAKWLEKNRPDLARWLGGRQIVLNQPYSHLNYRYATEAGGWVVVDALVDQRLLSTRARNNEEFLAAGRPALQWGRDLAQAARQSVSMMDGYLAVPPFPFAEAVPKK